MSGKIDGITGNPLLKQATCLETAYRSLASASQLKLFEAALEQAQSADANSSKQEMNSLMTQMQGLQNIQPIDPNAGPAGGPAQGKAELPESASTGKENPLATALLLSLAAISGSGQNLRDSNLGGAGIYSRGTASAAVPATHSPSPSPEIPRPSGGVGALSARFESGEDGTGVIGYDDKGGTSYGTYQIASRVGSMRQFLDYLDSSAPDLAQRLRASGPADTGSRKGEMPTVWKQIAAESPKRFAQLQHDFIEETHYSPALSEIYQKTGVNIEKQPAALREVLWSTAVQHGPKGAANIFCDAIEQAGGLSASAAPAKMIDSIYSARGRQFGGSTAGVRASVQGRFQQERAMALAMMGQSNQTTEAEA